MSVTQPAIEVRNLVKTFGSVRAIDDVSLTVDPGVFITLLGPSGCGKSTLLRTIAGFAAAESGSVLIDGQDVTALPANARPINMVFQDYALFPHMNVRRNIGFGCEMQGKSAREANERVDEMLELIQLPDLAYRYPEELSGGQRQRIALARALAPDPSALLLDEPLGALDLKLRLDLQRELKSLQRKTGKTFLFVTHDQEEAMSMSDLVAVMRDGRIEQLDRPEVIYSRPVNRYVGNFVGAANLLDGVVKSASTKTISLTVGALSLNLPASAVTTAGKLQKGEAVTIMIRPEDLVPADDVTDGHFSLMGRVVERTYMGNRVHIRFQTDDGVVFLADARAGTAVDTGDLFKTQVSLQTIAVLRSEGDD